MYNEKCKFASLSTMLVIVLILFVSGCATTKPMGSEQAQTLSLGQDSVVFMTLKVSNQYKPSYQPFVESMTVWKENGEKFRFIINRTYNEVKNQYNEYLITLSLPAGSYKIGRIYCFSRSMGSPYGTFYVPVFSDFELKQNKVVYLSHIEATVRQRGTDGGLMAGPSIPLLDQVTTGALRGTFDIKITDNFDEDIAIFKQKYSSVDNSSVEKTILPTWKKPSGRVIYEYESLRSEINMATTR